TSCTDWSGVAGPTFRADQAARPADRAPDPTAAPTGPARASRGASPSSRTEPQAAAEGTAKAASPTSISGRASPTITVVRLGSTPDGQCCVTKAPYASFMAAKSSRDVR